MGLAVHTIPALVGLPLVAAVACLMLTRGRAAALLSQATAAALLLLALSLIEPLRLSEAAGGLDYQLGGWGAPLGIDLYVDGLAIILLMLTAVLVLVLSFYSASYFQPGEKAARFWPLWWLLVAGLNSAFLAADIFNIYVALELIGLASVALVALDGSRDSQVAALRYALVGLLGSLFYLMGVALLYRAYGTLSTAELAGLAQADAVSTAALLLITVGLVLKTALFPLHFWLPPAHAGAPAPVSAVLSALVVKATFYLLIRYWLELLAPAASESAMFLLGILGACAIIWGCLAAFQAQRLKILVAYSTVAQLGYLFLLFPLLIAGGTAEAHRDAAVAAAVYFLAAHALAKSAMFLAAGNILRARGHDEIQRLRGIARQEPLSLFTFAIAGVSLIGLPPTGGFIAKWLFLNAAISSGQWWWVVIMLLGGLLAAIYIFKVLNLAFVQEDIDSPPPDCKPVPVRMALPGLVLAILAVSLGFNAELLLDLLAVAAGHSMAVAG
jgi:formate hydrogenlyase subunit 3/multisubunit Na+/H+ antiporter MnhD subunit